MTESGEYGKCNTIMPKRQSGTAMLLLQLDNFTFSRQFMNLYSFSLSHFGNDDVKSHFFIIGYDVKNVGKLAIIVTSHVHGQYSEIFNVDSTT